MNAVTRTDGGRAASVVEVCPGVVLDVDLQAPVIDVQVGAHAVGAWVLVRLFGEPLDLVECPVEDGRLSRETLLGEVGPHLRDVVTCRVHDAGGSHEDATSVLAGHGVTLGTLPPFLVRERRWLESGPEITVVLCTRNHAENVRAVLDSLREQIYRRFCVLVVDNNSDDEATLSVVAERPDDEAVTYVEEQRPGLSWARNRALSMIRTPVVAWIDDDEVADPHWLAQIAQAFGEDPGLAAVSGAVVPLELETPAQVHFERYGGHSKGRGFTPDLFDATAPGAQSPLYPLPPFGVGANMAFATERLRRIGGFDVALGAGTRSCGGEDTLAFTLVLLDGGRIAYRPSALTRHRHRRESAALDQQMYGYGVGLTAFYTSLLLRRPSVLPRLLVLGPRGLWDVVLSRGRGGAHALPGDFPPALLRRKSLGMLAGPWAYVRARSRSRDLAKASSDVPGGSRR